jgi:hypothetical protein
VADIPDPEIPVSDTAKGSISCKRRFPAPLKIEPTKVVSKKPRRGDCVSQDEGKYRAQFKRQGAAQGRGNLGGLKVTSPLEPQIRKSGRVGEQPRGSLVAQKS